MIGFTTARFARTASPTFTTRKRLASSELSWWSDHYDDYDTWLSAGSAGDMARLHGLDQVGFAGKVMSHPAYDHFGRTRRWTKYWLNRA